MNKQKLYDNTMDLLELKKDNSFKLFLKSLSCFSISKKRIIILGCLFIIIFNTQKLLLFPKVSAINIISDITVNINTVIIPLFGIIITGYAIFQALANGNTLIRLIQVSHKKESNKFAIYNIYFYGISIFYLGIIIMNFLLLITFKYLPSDWSLGLFSDSINEYIAAALITVYLVIIFNFLIEMKSFIYNLFQIFITNATSSAIEYLEDDKE